jgi:phosphohistidine phosphatase
MAAWLAEQSAPASWIWTSDAARALATSRFVAQGFTRATAQGATPHIVPEHRLYHATPEAACDVLRQTPDDVESVAVVAHNPGLTWLVNLLGGEQTVDNLPTFGVARFNVEGSWEQFDYPAAMLELLMAPKQLP